MIPILMLENFPDQIKWEKMKGYQWSQTYDLNHQWEQNN